MDPLPGHLWHHPFDEDPGLRRDRGDESDEQLPSQIICPVCGLRNDGMARFCRNCGLPLGAPRDPVRGTTSRRADLPSEHGAGIAAIVGLVAAVVVLAGAGFLILRNDGSSSTAVVPTATVPASAVPGATRAPGVSPVAGASTDPGLGPLPSRIPIRSGAPASAAPGTARPDPSAEPSATPLVGDTGFTCEPADLSDPSRGAWRVTSARWGARARWDELTLVLTREEGKGRTTVEVEAMTARQAAQVSGLDPAPTDRVILITFDGDVIIRSPIVATMGLKALDYLNVESVGDTTYAVVGVDRDGCYRLFAPAWKKGQTAGTGDTIELLLDVRYR